MRRRRAASGDALTRATSRLTALLPIGAAGILLVALPRSLTAPFGFDALYWLGLPAAVATLGAALALYAPRLGRVPGAAALALSAAPLGAGAIVVFALTANATPELADAYTTVIASLAASAVQATVASALAFAAVVALFLRRSEWDGARVAAVGAIGLLLVSAARAVDSFALFGVFRGWRLDSSPDAGSPEMPPFQPPLDEVLAIDAWAAGLGLAARLAPLLALALVVVVFVYLRRRGGGSSSAFAATAGVLVLLSSAAAGELSTARMQARARDALAIEPWRLAGTDDFRPVVMTESCSLGDSWQNASAFERFEGLVLPQSGDPRRHRRGGRHAPFPRRTPEEPARTVHDVHMTSPAREEPWSDVERILDGQFPTLSVAVDRRANADAIRSLVGRAASEGIFRVDFVGVHQADTEHGQVRVATHPLLSAFGPELVHCPVLTRLASMDGEPLAPFAIRVGERQVRSHEASYAFEIGEVSELRQLTPNEWYVTHVWLGGGSMDQLIDTLHQLSEAHVVPMLLDDRQREPDGLPLPRSEAFPDFSFRVQGPLRNRPAYDAVAPLVSATRACWTDPAPDDPCAWYAQLHVEIDSGRVEARLTAAEPRAIHPCIERALTGARADLPDVNAEVFVVVDHLECMR